MASFEEILKRPASEIKPPQPFPVGTYHCLVDGPPQRDKSSRQQVDLVRFKFKILAVMDDVNKAEAAEQQVIGKIIQSDYYDGSLWRLKEMLDSCGISDANQKPLDEMMAEAPGKQLLVKLRHEAGQDGIRVFHRVDSTAKV